MKRQRKVVSIREDADVYVARLKPQCLGTHTVDYGMRSYSAIDIG